VSSVASAAFERSLALPSGVYPTEVVANYEDGVLEVRVPKARREPRRNRGQGAQKNGRGKKAE